MAKALLGYMSSSDPRAVARLTSETRRLRQRVADLESQLVRVQAENDALAAAVHEPTLMRINESMQPV